MKEEYVDVEVYLDNDIIKAVKGMNKKELINRIFTIALEAKLAEDKLKAVRQTLTNKAEVLQTKLDKAEAYVEQGRAMIESVMNRWYEYDA